MDSPRARPAAALHDGALEETTAEVRDDPTLQYPRGEKPPVLVETLEAEEVLLTDLEGLPQGLHAFFKQELEHVIPADNHKRALLLYELGHLEEVFFQDPARALHHFEAAHLADVAFPPAQRALRRHYARAGRWPDYLRVLEEEINVTADPELRSALLTHQGEVLGHRLTDLEGAVKQLKAALNLAPRQRRAAELLRSFYAREERWSELLDILRALVNITADGAERARLMVEMAEIHEFRLVQTVEAEELYTQALSLDPLNEAAAVALRRIYPAHQRWKELADLLAREAGRDHEPEERFADLYRAARISELHLQDDARAASLLETAAALRPTDPLPLQALIRIYQRTGRYEDLAAALGRQLRLVRDPADRASLCYQLGRIYEDWLDQPTEAMSSYREALKEQPGHEAAIRALTGLYERFERWEELLDLSLLRAERCKDTPRRADGYLRAATICEHRVKDLRRAVDLYDRAYRMVPGLPLAFRALQRIHRRSGQWDALAELFERQASITRDPSLAVSFFRSAAWIYEEMLKSKERAIGALERLQGKSPDDREALVDLARLYEEVGRSEDLHRTLQRWAEVCEDELERIEIQRSIGELLEGPLRKPEQALQTYRELLRAAPADRPTRERLKAFFERSGRWSDLVEVLRSELTVIPDGPEQAPLLLQVGRLCLDKLGDREGARAALEEALTADPSFTPAMSALQDILREGNQWERLVDILSAKAERVREPVRAAATLCNASEVCEEQLGDRKRAETFFMRALELDPANVPARHGLERLYLSTHDWGALESHYLREAESTKDPMLRLRAYLRLGTLFDGEAKDPVGAAASYESALRVMENQPDALRALAALLRRTGNWERLAALLARIAGTTHDREAAVAALKEWATIVEVHLADQWDPAPIFERILEAVPTDAHALFALESLAYERSEQEALVSLALKQIRMGGEPDRIVSLTVRAASLLLSWERFPEAAEVLRTGLKASPDYLPAIRLLRQVDEQLGEWGEVAELLLREGELAYTPEVAHLALVRAGNVLLDRFSDTRRARAAFERVFATDPGNAAAFGRLAAILSSAGEWGALVTLYGRRMEALDPPARVPLMHELAALQRDQLLDPAAAIGVLADLLELAPADVQALSEISELCMAQSRWRDAEIYLQQLALAAVNNPEARRDALLQRSEILEEELGEEEQAMEALQQLLDEFPGDRRALSRCMLFYQHRGNWEKTVEVLEDLARSGVPAERINHLVNLAEIFSRTLHDPERAHAALRRAASLCVDTGEGVERISEYFERRGDFEGLVEFMGEALDGLPPEGAPGAVPVRLATAHVLAGRLLRPSEAEIEIRKALQTDPASLPARLELAGLHLWGDNLGEAISEYMKILDQDPFSVDAFRGLYRVYDRRGDLERAGGAAQAVCAVGGKDAVERKIAAQTTAPMEAMLSSAVATPLGVQDFWHLMAHPDEPQVARELLYHIADFIPQVFPHEVERAQSGSIIPLSEEDALAQRCAHLAQVLGVDRFECCIGQHLSASVVALPGVPPKLVVDDTFASRASAAEFRFAAGRALSGVLTRSLYLSVLPPHLIELLLAAVVDLFERGFSGYLGQRREVEEISRNVARSIPRKLRKMLEEPARGYAEGQPVAAAAWYVASQRSAERAGLLLAGDVEASISVLVAEKASRSVQADLLRFAIGPHLYEARRRLGISN